LSPQLFTKPLANLYASSNAMDNIVGNACTKLLIRSDVLGPAGG